MIDEQEQEWVYFKVYHELPEYKFKKRSILIFLFNSFITILSLIKVIDNESIKVKALADTN